MAKGLLLSAKCFCHLCYRQVEGKDAACGLQIFLPPRDLGHQDELNLVLCQCAWSCPQPTSSTHIHQSNIPVLNMKYMMRRFLPLHPTEALLSVDVFHHPLRRVHLLHFSSLFTHHPKIYAELQRNDKRPCSRDMATCHPFHHSHARQSPERSMQL